MARESYLGTDRPRKQDPTRSAQRPSRHKGWDQHNTARDYRLSLPRKEEPTTSRTPVVPKGRSHTPQRLPQLDLPRDAYPDSPMIGAQPAQRDPRVPIDLGDPELADPYNVAGGRGYDEGGPMDGVRARGLVDQFLRRQFGFSQTEADQLSLDETQSLIEQYAPKEQRLRDALGVLTTESGALPEDPSAGPGMRFVPNGR